jgi:hypothetical protein
MRAAGAKGEMLRLGLRAIVEPLAASPDATLRERARGLLAALNA